MADVDGERYLVIRQLIRNAGEWRMAGGSEGPDRAIPGKADPYLDLFAVCGDGMLFAGGRVQRDARDIARVRLVWDDGCALEDRVENTIVLFFGVHNSLPAAAEFLDPAGRAISRQSLADEPA